MRQQARELHASLQNQTVSHWIPPETTEADIGMPDLSFRSVYSTKVRSKSQDCLQENTVAAMDFDVEKNMQKSQLLIQMKARDVMKTLSLEFIHKFGGVFLLWYVC